MLFLFKDYIYKIILTKILDFHIAFFSYRKEQLINSNFFVSITAFNVTSTNMFL